MVSSDGFTAVMVMLSCGSAKAGLGGGDWAVATDGISAMAAMTLAIRICCLS
jgi:hypothetical protein